VAFNGLHGVVNHKRERFLSCLGSQNLF
jgi:hypothetical protein